MFSRSKVRQKRGLFDRQAVAQNGPFFDIIPDAFGKTILEMLKNVIFTVFLAHKKMTFREF